MSQCLGPLVLAVRSDQSTPIQIAIKIIKAVRPELFTRILRRIAHYKFIDTATVEKKPLSALKPSPIQHEVLPPELTSRIRLIRASLLDVDAHSMSHWIDGFKRDSHPSTEIAFWERVASVYLEYSRMIQPMSNEQKQQIYTFISSIWLSSTGAELMTLRPSVETRRDCSGATSTKSAFPSSRATN